MNKTLDRWNLLDADSAAQEILPCCGSHAWAAKLSAKRPLADETALLAVSSSVWLSLPEEAWHEAFNSHPRIGEQKAQAHATTASMEASAKEQSTALSADEAAKVALREGNQLYEQKFGRIFIVCASGRSANQILNILESRMNNDATTELHEAAEQQRQITELRLRRWLEAD
jgi:2-oxo-4-hydroxy-4-carboxy-5-ureidoimidazoline decarboxylase